MVHENLCCPYCHSENVALEKYCRPYPKVGNGYLSGCESRECGLCGYGKNEFEAYEDMLKNVNLHRITEAIKGVAIILKRKLQEAQS